MARILVVEDEAALRRTIAQSLVMDGHSTVDAGCVKDAWDLMRRHEVDALITDLNLVGESGLDLVERARSEGFAGPIIVITAFGTIETAIDAIKRGADEFIQKPIRLDELGLVVSRSLENRRVRTRLDLLQRLQKVSADAAETIGESEGWKRTLGLARRFATIPVPKDSAPGELPTILLLGETGAGKGVVARYIQTADPHFDSANPPAFVHVNCAALPPSLIESELFGHEKGAFTDAKGARPGLFELAEGGTIFLDEIGEMALEMQSKLLLVVERGIFRRIGGQAERRVRARIVAATNQDLERRVHAGLFRADLLFRLNALTIHVPALRERAGDALLIADALLKRLSEQLGRPLLRLSQPARDMIRSHPWPGNVRQLANALRRAALLADGQEVRASDLGLSAQPASAGHLHAGAANGVAPAAHEASPPATIGATVSIDFSRGPVTLESLERKLIIEALRHARGNVSMAAKLIGLNRGALRYRIERLGLEPQVRELNAR